MVFSNDRSAEEVQRVNQQLEQRHYEFRSNCNDGDGDASACHSWGEWLAVVDKNYTDAAEMYKLNCDKNNYAASCFNLGRLKPGAGARVRYDDVVIFHVYGRSVAGKGVEMNDFEATNLFAQNLATQTEKSCDGGHSQGCHHLGVMYMNGVGRDKNVLKGLEAFKEACERDDADSCNRVASMYLSATEKSPIKRDAPLAKRFLERACDANFAPACHNLAVMYKKGDIGIEKSEEKFEEYRNKTNELIAQAGGMSGVKTT